MEFHGLGRGIDASDHPEVLARYINDHAGGLSQLDPGSELRKP